MHGQLRSEGEAVCACTISARCAVFSAKRYFVRGMRPALKSWELVKVQNYRVTETCVTEKWATAPPKIRPLLGAWYGTRAPL